MQKKGTGLDELYETLKQFNTKSKSILPAGNSKTVVTFNFRNHDYIGWNIACTGDENPINKLKGKRYDRFLMALKALYKTTSLFEIRNNDSVLCYRDTEPERENGRIVSHWFDLSPAFPYVIGMDGQPKFNVLRLALNDWEYSRMMETRLAFSHNGIYYPLLKTSLHSVGSRLDCSAAFKQLDACPLGGALLLAEKFAQVNALVVQYRDSTERVRPVLSVSGRDFVHVPLTEYFQKAIANIPGIYDMVHWEVTDDGALADFRLIGSGDDTFIRIEGGDLPGKTMRVSACVCLAGAETLYSGVLRDAGLSLYLIDHPDGAGTLYSKSHAKRRLDRDGQNGQGETGRSRNEYAFREGCQCGFFERFPDDAGRFLCRNENGGGSSSSQAHEGDSQYCHPDVYSVSGKGS